MIHKNYASGIPIQISVYDHQLVIWNPGRLSEDWSVESLLGKYPSVPFNPLVANAFFRAGYIESWGRGIERIQEDREAAGKALVKILQLLRDDPSLSLAGWPAKSAEACEPWSWLRPSLPRMALLRRIGPDKNWRWSIRGQGGESDAPSLD